MYQRALAGGAVALVAGGTAGVSAFVYAPPVPLDGWSVYARLFVAVLAFGGVFAVVWFLTMLTTIAGMGGSKF